MPYIGTDSTNYWKGTIITKDGGTMKVEKIYIGGWFQRTMLHLSEVYRFLKDGTSDLALDSRVLQKNRKSLNIKDLVFEVKGFEKIVFNTHDDINVKIYEDGLMVLSKSVISDDYKQDIEILKNYYEKSFSSAYSYLFSLGAPVPKELANIKTFFPYFLLFNNAKKETLQSLFQEKGSENYSTHSNDNFEVLDDDTYFLINSKKGSVPLSRVDRYIEETIFFREFKAQLHRYLNLHRTIWEEVASIKEKTNVKSKEIDQYAAKVELYYKTMNLVDTRISQMGSYLKTRERIAKDNPDFESFLGIMNYRYETLNNTMVYIQDVWGMTKNYVVAARELYRGLQTKITQKLLNNLTIVSAIGMSAALLGLFQVEGFGFPIWGFIFGGLSVTFGYAAVKFIQFISGRGKHKISDKDYEKFK